MGCKEAIQLLNQAEELKLAISKKPDLLNDSLAWINQGKLLDIYYKVLVLDLEYALDKKVEQDLWNVGFKSYITHLLEEVRDKKNPRRFDIQPLLSWTLESAAGFYVSLLQEICNTFEAQLPFRCNETFYGRFPTCRDPYEQNNNPQIASYSYICQYCLVHLGDIARYRNHKSQAEIFYRKAIEVSPLSGHPYNQLAILETSQGDKLTTAFYYIQGICVRNPFPASKTNLINTLNSAIDKERPLEKVQTKMTVNEYIQLFLCAHGHFHSMLDSKQANLIVQSLNCVMTALVATQSFKKEELIKITTINMYALTNLSKEMELTEDELAARDMILQLISGSLSAFLMPVYTLQNDKDLLQYYALPSVKLLTYFLRNNPDILKTKAFKERMQVWPSLSKLVNAAQRLLAGFNRDMFAKTPLKEDCMLRAFLPLEPNFKKFDFGLELGDREMPDKVRLSRIVGFAEWLSEHDLEGTKLIKKNENNKGLMNFEPVLSQPDPTIDLLEEMKSITFQETFDKSNSNSNGVEKKSGILKPQGSLEKSREEKKNEATTENVQNSLNLARSKRAKQNVALQSIFKKIEDNKQVKFNVDQISDKEKSVKFDQKITTAAATAIATPSSPPKPSANNQLTHSNTQNVRPQNFNNPNHQLPLKQAQNQPANDYLTNLRSLGKGVDSMMPQFSKNNFSSSTSQQQQQQQQQQQNNFKLPQFPPPLNMPPPQFNAWSRDDLKLPQSQGGPTKWYNQTSTTFNNQQQQEKTFANQQQPYFPVGYPSEMYQQYNFPYPNQMPTQSPWSTTGQQQQAFGDGLQNAISVRQAMLKEATARNNPQNIQELPMPPTSGYTLFNNSSSWAPSHLQNPHLPSLENAIFNGPQHSLFGGPGPQSLAQLLKHQQNQLGPNIRHNTNQGT